MDEQDQVGRRQPDELDVDTLPGGVSPQPALALDEDERLPWLESAEDDDDVATVDSGRILRLALFGLIVLAGVVAVLWAFGNGGGNGAQVADGSVIKAPAEPYKQVPKDQGGKTFAGTGDSAFAVSEGRSTQPRLGGVEASVTPVSSAAAVDTPEAAPAGVGVQVGAYMSPAAAEAGWTRLSGSHEALKGLKHRVLEGSADIGTVYRLQAVTADVAAANSLCATLKSAGVACQVKR